MNRRIMVYVAGPYSSATPEGIELNVATALDAYNAVLDLGLNAYLPHFSHFAHQRKARDYETWMEVDFAWIERCDVLYRMPGASSGGDREVARARELGIPVVFSFGDLIVVAGTIGALGLGKTSARIVPRAAAKHDPATCEVCSEKRQHPQDWMSRPSGKAG